jgi:hypothetical protein
MLVNIQFKLLLQNHVAKTTTWVKHCCSTSNTKLRLGWKCLEDLFSIALLTITINTKANLTKSINSNAMKSFKAMNECLGIKLRGRGDGASELVSVFKLFFQVLMFSFNYEQVLIDFHVGALRE